MIPTPFERLLEDVIREELLSMGHDFDDIVHSVSEKRDGEIHTVRFRGDLHDLDVVEPAELPSRDALAAQLRRKLDAALSRRA